MTIVVSTLGGATAAAVITGKDIKDKSITAQDIRPKTIKNGQIARNSLGT